MDYKNFDFTLFAQAQPTTKFSGITSPRAYLPQIIQLRLWDVGPLRALPTIIPDLTDGSSNSVHWMSPVFLP